MEIWEEPVRGGYAPPWFLGLNGRGRHDAWAGGHLPFPPIHNLTGCRPVETGPGGSQSVMPATRWLLSPQGRIPLGVLTILADLAYGTALADSLPTGGSFTTAELSLTRVQDCSLGGNILAVGRSIHVADSSALTEASLYDGEGRMVAFGTSRIALFPPPPDLPEVPDPLPPMETPSYDTPDPWEREPPTSGVLDPTDWDDRAGRDVLDLQIQGDLPPPPISRLTGMQVVEADQGTATVTLPATEWLSSPSGFVQGGVTAMVADAALACAIQTTVDRGDRFLPVDIKVNYLRPIRPTGGHITATGEVTHRGRSIAVAHAIATDADGKRVALATGSAAISPSS